MPADPLAPVLALPGVADSVAGVRAAVDSLLTHRVLRRRSADVSAESSLRGAWASAVLAGADVRLADVRSGAAGQSPQVQGALRVQAALPAMADTWSRAPRQVLARLHTLAAADLVPDPDGLGRPAPGTAPRLDVLAEVIAATSAPASVVAGIVAGELLALDAFPPVSGLVARAAVRLTLIERGLDPRSLVVVEVGELQVREEAQEALAAYRSGTPAGIARWLVHHSGAVVAGAQEATAICEAILRG